MLSVKNHWFPILLSKELKNKPISTKIFGIPIVCFRNQSGEARTLLDVCPHQATSLSLGKVVNGNIRCPLHHWDFDGEGKCIKAKLLAESQIPKKAKAVSLPTLEKEDLIWIWPGEKTKVEKHHSYLENLPKEEKINNINSISVTLSFNWLTFMKNSSDPYHFYGLHHKTLQLIAPEAKQIQEAEVHHEIKDSQLLSKLYYQNKLVVSSIYYNPFSVFIKSILNQRKLKFWYEIYATPFDVEKTRTTFRLYVTGGENRLSRFLTSIVINFIYKTLVYFGAKYEDIPILESQTQNRALGASENLCYLDRQIIIYNKYLSAYDLNDMWFKDFGSLIKAHQNKKISNNFSN